MSKAMFIMHGAVYAAVSTAMIVKDNWPAAMFAVTALAWVYISYIFDQRTRLAEVRAEEAEEALTQFKR